jgi:hypothetical protein
MKTTMTDEMRAASLGTQPGNLLWGRSAVTKTVASGLWLCPNEARERAYWHHRVRNWTTVLSIPVIPGDVIEEYVECFCCGATAHPAILQSDHPALLPPTKD